MDEQVDPALGDPSEPDADRPAPAGPVADVLPPAEPTLVVLGGEDPRVVQRLDELARPLATSIDLRSGLCWLEVPDGRRFVELVIDELGGGRRDVRIAFAPVDARLDDLFSRVLMAPDLDRLADALEHDRLAANPPEYHVHYQPVIDLASRHVIGYESLIRANARGLAIPPEELISRARRGGWLVEFDQLGRTLALNGLGGQLGRGLLFLNLMAPDGRFDLDAVQATVDLASAQGLEADQIVLEASERHQYDLDGAAEQIDELRKLGLRVAIDDIGDGYASLLLVSRFRPDIIKIAGQLIDDLPSPEARSVIKAVVDMAHEIGIWVVAENVESAEQVDLLSGLGVDWGQGHYFGGPEAGTLTGAEAAQAPAHQRPG